MKIVALDIGDVWTGVALSDPLHIIARPYTTIETQQLSAFITTLAEKESFSTVVVGYPKTMRGTESEQTRKIVAYKEQLAQQFPHYTWILWDERLSSKRAAHLKKTYSKEDKLRAHALAAASILETYLQYKALSAQ
jgi:putative holliday junction resolvase